MHCTEPRAICQRCHSALTFAHPTYWSTSNNHQHTSDQPPSCCIISMITVKEDSSHTWLPLWFQECWIQFFGCIPILIFEVGFELLQWFRNMESSAQIPINLFGNFFKYPQTWNRCFKCPSHGQHRKWLNDDMA